MQHTAWVVRAEDEPPAEWEHALPADALHVAAADSPAAADAALRAGCMLLGAHVDGVIERLRTAHRVDPSLQAVIVVTREHEPELRRELLFARGVGEVWFVAPDSADAALIERASDVTGRRRRHRRTSDVLNNALASSGLPATGRTNITDAYLASLLEAAPNPILSVDADGIVLSWNPGAEQTLGYPRGDAVGRPLAELLGAPALDLRTLPATGSSRVQTSFVRPDGEHGVADCTIAPAEADGVRVYAVMLHDITEERRTQEMLEAQASELEAQATELELQATELQQYTEELETVNDLLLARTRAVEKAAGARGRFYASMSHELRTPINAIIGYNALVLDGIYGPVPDAQREPLERGQRAARHLLELINDVLDLSKIEAGRIEIQLEPTCMPAVAEELLDTVRPLAAEYGSDIVVEGSGTHCVTTDSRRVRQILLNLLSNAIKFGEGRTVTIRWQAAADDGVIIDVADNGIGIAEDDLARIFEEFTQVPGGSPGGTGLGLPISRSLASLLGGTLTVQSAPGEGSTFRLTLPAVSQPQPPVPSTPVAPSQSARGGGAFAGQST